MAMHCMRVEEEFIEGDMDLTSDTYKPKYQPWNEEEFRSDIFVQSMTPLQRWMYRALIQAAFFHSTRPYLPNDDDLLWRLAGCETREQWEANKAAILPRFTTMNIVVDGHKLLAQKRVLADWDSLMKVRSVNTKRINRRWGKDTDCIPAVSSGIPDNTACTDPEYKIREDKIREDKRREDKKTISSDDSTEFSIEDTIHGNAVREVWDYYLKTVGKDPELNDFTTKRKKIGLTRLKECLKKTGGDLGNAVKAMKIAIDSLAKSDFHMGRDPRFPGKKYNDFEKNVFRSYEQMEKWWN